MSAFPSPAAALPMTATLFTLGTRGSPLALANETRWRLSEAHGSDVGRIALKIIRTSGDVLRDRALYGETCPLRPF